MTAKEILEEIKPLGRESYKRMLFNNYGVKEPCFGVKIGDLKKIQKRIKKDYQLALDLYDTGNYDAMYLAGLIADDARMTKKDLQRWVEKALCRVAARRHRAVGRGRESARARTGAGMDRIAEAAGGRGRLGDAEQPGGHQGRRRTRPGGIETAVAARAEDDSPGAGCWCAIR